MRIDEDLLHAPSRTKRVRTVGFHAGDVAARQCHGACQPRAAQSSEKVRAVSNGLSAVQIAILLFYAAALAGGQLLFKMAAMRGAGDGPLIDRLAARSMDTSSLRLDSTLR